MQNEKILKLIKLYQQKVQEAVDLLKKYLDFEQPSGSWMMKGIEPEGDIGPNKEYHYFFHGGGCNMKLADVVVDWDYGYYGRHDGFNAHRVSEIAKQIEGYEEFQDLRIVQTYLDKLKEEGVIENTEIGDQYYFTDAPKPIPTNPPSI